MKTQNISSRRSLNLRIGTAMSKKRHNYAKVKIQIAFRMREYTKEDHKLRLEFRIEMSLQNKKLRSEQTSAQKQEFEMKRLKMDLEFAKREIIILDKTVKALEMLRAKEEETKYQGFVMDFQLLALKHCRPSLDKLTNVSEVAKWLQVHSEATIYVRTLGLALRKMGYEKKNNKFFITT